MDVALVSGLPHSLYDPFAVLSVRGLSFQFAGLQFQPVDISLCLAPFDFPDFLFQLKYLGGIGLVLPYLSVRSLEGTLAFDLGEVFYIIDRNLPAIDFPVEALGVLL